MSNFDYISDFKELAGLYKVAVDAELLQVSEPRQSAEMCKHVLFEICKLSAQKLNVDCSGTLSDLLDNESLVTELSNMDVLRQIRQVRRRSNAVANLGDDLNGMPYIVELLYHIVGTVLVGFGYIKSIPEYVPMSGISFDIPSEPID